MTKVGTGAMALAIGWALGGGGCTVGGGHTHPEASTGAEQERKLDTFSVVRLEGAFEAQIFVGSPQQVLVQGDPEAVRNVATTVSDGELKVHFTKHRRMRRDDVRVIVVTPELTALTAAGALVLKVDGLRGPAFDLTVQGTTNTHLEGEVDMLTAELSGAASLNSLDLLAQAVDIEINGTGVANVTALARLDAEIDGTGRVRYRGDPTVKKSISGIGRISPF